MVGTGEYWTTRQAAHFLNLSTVAMLGKVDLLGATKVQGAYQWPIDRVKEYAKVIAGKSLNDPTRNRSFDEDG